MGGLSNGERIARLINDPDVNGDLLLVGIVLAANFDLDDVTAPNVREIAKLAGMPYFRARMTFQLDSRTYRTPNAEGRRQCDAPMIRRSTPCGCNSTRSGEITDWETGERSTTAACTRHSGWFEKVMRANYAAKPADPPLPPANSGGALAKHFPHVNWPKFWHRIDPRWVQHPEVKPWPKPQLSLLLGDGDDTASTNRPVLALAETETR